MRNKVIWSFLSLVALGTGGLVAGCDSDAKITKSAEGDSCTKTSDCDDGLRCEQNTCFKGTSHIDTSGGAPSGSAGEPGVVVPPPPVLGGPGESCTKRADCGNGLNCLSQRCTAGAEVGAGGDGPGPGPMLGGLGETCVLTTDCATGFVCLPGTIAGEGFTGAGVGVCEPVKNGLTATGNICGAECKTAADCCELPVAVHVPYAAIGTPGASGPYGTGANSCVELAALLDGVDCATTKVAAELVQCFAQTAYCECSKTAWACSDAGRCEYNAACVTTTAGSVPGGCPSYTRTGTALAVTCNKAKKCAPEAFAGCKADKDCDETVAVFDSPTDTCANGKCTCDTKNGQCYRSCTEDLDCPVRFTCDTKTSLCTGGSECDTNSFCVTQHNDVNSKCVAGICQSSCSNDLDCNFGRLTESSSTRVCNAQHVCEDVGCEADDQCPPVGGVRTFCTRAPGLPEIGGVASAVTD